MLINNIFNLNLINKKIYLSPYNDLTNSLQIELFKQGIEISGFIDRNKTGDSIYNDVSKLDDYDYIFIWSPKYAQVILDNLTNRSKVFVVQRIGYYKYSYMKAKFFSKNIFNIFIRINNYLYRLPSSIRRLKLFILHKYSVAISNNEVQIKLLSHKHNSRMFIIGNGPSLDVSDLDKLQNEITIACNMIYLVYNITKWRPTYHMVEDELDMFQNYKDFKNIKGSIKVYPSKFLNTFPAIPNAIYYRYIKSKTLLEVSNSIEYGLYSGVSVTMSMLQLSMSMGAKEIYLLGNDFTYTTPNDTKRNSLYKTEGEINHFHKDYRKENDLWVDPNYEGMLKQFQAIEDFAKLNGIKIYNVSRKSKLDIFEKKNFDEVIS